MNSCPARVLLCAMTKVGLFRAAMTLAMVKVLPEPVTPSKVWKSSGKSNVVFKGIYFAVENDGENYFVFCYNEK